MLSRIGRQIRLLADDPRAFGHAQALRIRLARIRLVNRLSRKRVTGDAPAIVNLTSYGHRISTVYYTIESIAAGSTHPARMILWLDDAEALRNPPPQIRRLIARGLEVLPTDDFGPHKKQYAFALTDDASGLPLVAADDDVLYPSTWLAGLVAAFEEHPTVVNGYRAHTMSVLDGVIAPYAEWAARTTTTASYGAMCTGVSGIIYPPALIAALRSEGDTFRTVAPFADDVWVNAVSARHGFRTRQIDEKQAEFPAIPGSQKGTLYRRNVKEGGNDPQVAASFGPLEIARIAEDIANGL